MIHDTVTREVRIEATVKVWVSTRVPTAQIETALSYDDVLLPPAESAVLPAEVDLSTRLTTGITLNAR